MPKNSLFRKYFAVFCTTCVLSILVLGSILMAFATRYFQNDRYADLERNARQAASITAANYAGNNYRKIDRSLTLAYSALAFAANADIFLVDLTGEVRLSAGYGDRVHDIVQVPHEAVERASGGKYEATTTFYDHYDEPYYIVGVPVRTDNATIATLFAVSSAQSLNTFLWELVKMFLLSAVVVLFLTTALTYVITARLVRPLKDMLHATQSFSQGDFSKRVPVGSYDEIGQLAMAFNNMASTLATTEQTRRSFVANVSHELKTPMTTIGGFVDGILDGTIPEEKRDQYLQVVSNEVKRLSRLVRSMLDTARIEAGEMVMHPVAFDISETIRQTIFTFEQIIEEKQLELRGLEVGKVMVMADIDLMHQVVYNLLENAVKFVNQEGYIEVRYQHDGQRTYIAIRNSGEGIDREEVPQLFERFYKSDKSRSLNKNGVGLGLHIVRSIISYHKGEIVVRSVEHEYTEFEFWIPDPPKSGKSPMKKQP